MARTPRIPGRPTSTQNPSALLFNSLASFPSSLCAAAGPRPCSLPPHPDQAAVGERDRKERRRTPQRADAEPELRRRATPLERPWRRRRPFRELLRKEEEDDDAPELQGDDTKLRNRSCRVQRRRSCQGGGGTRSRKDVDSDLDAAPRRLSASSSPRRVRLLTPKRPSVRRSTRRTLTSTTTSTLHEVTIQTLLSLQIL
ncbi:hypothetical protein U9M48_010366 [Paspalum notatum var. saurae]|uniref:Uncharacterized protein n=1 Tax=Paspalum notatum var. saurae TaxID=547442 RepID=A0AAQ3ST42_PASNO